MLGMVHVNCASISPNIKSEEEVLVATIMSLYIYSVFRGVIADARLMPFSASIDTNPPASANGSNVPWEIMPTTNKRERGYARLEIIYG